MCNLLTSDICKPIQVVFTEFHLKYKVMYVLHSSGTTEDTSNTFTGSWKCITSATTWWQFLASICREKVAV